MLSEAKQISDHTKHLRTLLAAATVGLSWLVTQVVFTFHYAHEFYRPDDTAEKLAGGLEFPHDSKPDYWDFFYFATSLGAASQTSDVAIRTKALRRLVTLHAVVVVLLQHGGARTCHQHRRQPYLTPAARRKTGQWHRLALL